MSTVPYLAFNNGFVTEGNPLQYPEGATKDELNFDLLPDGTRAKRLGLDIEDGGIRIGQGASDAVSTHLWNTQIDGTKFIVVQFDLELYIWPGETDPVSSSSPYLMYDFGDDVTAILDKPPELDFASGNGYLIAVGQNVKPLYFVYKGMSGDTPIIESGTIDIEIRDFVGVDDSLAVDTRPANLTSLHRYNLQNQGWEIEDGILTDLYYYT